MSSKILSFFKTPIPYILGVAAAAFIFMGQGPSAEPTRVYSSPGGSVYDFLGEYEKLRVTNGKLEIQGLCASACTYFLNIVPEENVCANYDHAMLGFHGVYRGGLFDKTAVEFFHPRVYPERVIELLNSKGFDGTTDVDRSVYPMGVIWLTPEEVGVKEC